MKLVTLLKDSLCLLTLMSLMSSAQSIETVQITNPSGDEVTLSLGSSINMECEVTNIVDSKIKSLQWMFSPHGVKQKVVVQDSAVVEVLETKGGGGITLSISRLSFLHDGRYFCVLQTTEGKRLEDSKTLMVEGVPYIVLAKSTYPGNIGVQLGEQVSLVCYVTARPEATVTWYKDGYKLKSGTDGYTTTEEVPASSGTALDLRYRLAIDSVEAHHLAQYQCKPRNVKGLSTSFATWTLELRGSTLVMTIPGTSDISLFYGESLKIRCEGRKFPTSDKIRLRFSEVFGNITEFTNSNGGQYQFSSYRNGDDIEITELKIARVDFRHEGTYTCESSSYSVALFVAVVGEPMVTVKNSDVVSLPGESITLQCHVSSRPTPTTIGWFYEDTAVKTSSSYNVYTTVGDPDSSSALMIYQLKERDFGNKYSCRAVNKHGEGEKTVTITDVDECRDGSHDCLPDLDEVCQDTFGSFTCVCMEGFEMVGQDCINVNECADGIHDCRPARNEMCVDLPGSYNCRCIPGFVKVGNFCRIPGTPSASTTSPPRAPPAAATSPAVIGASVGVCLLIVVIVVIVVVVVLRRRKDNKRTLEDVPEAGASKKEDGLYNAVYDNTGENPHDYVELSTPGDEFTPSRLRLLSTLGEGKFGRAVKAEALSIKNTKKWDEVAVKMVKEGATQDLRADFYHELVLLRKIPAHPNVVKYLGCVTMSDPMMIIMEYVDGGDLLNCLRNKRPDYATPYSEDENITPKDLLSFALQISRGLAHIAAHKIVHRDVAARNVLISSDKVCKISDFGLARDVEGADVYERTHQGPLPVRWMAPESLLDSIHTTKSDVWAFGVLLWEIVTLGSSPYPGMSGKQVLTAVLQGERLQCPPQCARDVYDVMMSCWKVDPKKRPSFSELVVTFERLLEVEGDYIQLENIDDGIYMMLESTATEEKV